MADIFGTIGNDTLTGTTNPDVIAGGDGNDVIDGGLGSDSIDGGAGNDSLLGAPGNDTLTGGAGSDTLTGGNGNDILNGTDATAAGSGEIDTLTGSGGTDIFILGDANQAYYTAAGTGDYAIISDFNPLQETVQLKGIPSDYAFIQNGSNAELYLGSELIAIFQNQTVAALDLNSNIFTYVGSGLDVVGTAADDLIEGGDGFDIIAGGDGNDTIVGGAGRDNLSGDAGNDTIDAGTGNDIIAGGDGNDSIDAGDGNDSIDAGIGDDTIIGGAGNDNIIAAPGFDTVVAGSGNDTVNGGGQDDILNGTSSSAAGAGEVDVIIGGSGNDRFILGDENSAYYTAAGNADYAQINDFSTGEVIQLHGTAADYSLVQSGTNTEIRYNGELVGLLLGQTAANLNLNGSQFEYVLPPNVDPIAVADSFTTDEDTSLTIAATDLLSNDSDANGDSLTITEVNDAVNGVVSLEGDQVMFTPDPGFFGEASFNYTISDGKGGSSTTTVTVTVNEVLPPNVDPIAVADSFTTDEDTSLTIAATDLLSNDSDANGDSLTITEVNDAVNGVVSLEGDQVMFTPDSGFFGEASFNYTISDSKGGSSTTTVTVTVNEVIEVVPGIILTGGWRNDTLNGGEGNDELTGGLGSDRLFGNGGDDLLKGAGWSRGFLERDTLTGGAGADTFVLGDETASYYKGGFLFDYALVTDFNSQEDTLQLHGSAAEYKIQSSGDSTYLYQTQKVLWFTVQDLVAVIQGDSVDLNSSAVQFLG
ncbi:MAG: Ig-like domain-containing protein [Prochlorotrichaceae cyanobacterium]